MPTDKTPVDAVQIASDMDIFRDVVALLTEPAAKEILGDFVATVENLQRLATELDSASKNLASAQRQAPPDEARAAAMRAHIEVIAAQALQIETRTLPDLMRRLQESTQNEQARQALGQIAHSLGGARGVTAEGEASPQGDGGASIWGDD